MPVLIYIILKIDRYRFSIKISVVYWLTVLNCIHKVMEGSFIVDYFNKYMVFVPYFQVTNVKVIVILTIC